VVLEHCDKLLYQNSFAISQYADFLETNKERLPSLLCVMQSYFRDILVYKKTKKKDLIINGDKSDSIMKAAQDFTSGALSNIIEVILETERRFFIPVNFRLAAEKMFFDILEEKQKWKKS
jgi:DNA polymerase III subunit delta'